MDWALFWAVLSVAAVMLFWGGRSHQNVVSNPLNSVVLVVEVLSLVGGTRARGGCRKFSNISRVERAELDRSSMFGCLEWKFLLVCTWLAGNRPKLTKKRQ